jgi:hypothetical protein
VRKITETRRYLADDFELTAMNRGVKTILYEGVSRQTGIEPNNMRRPEEVGMEKLSIRSGDHWNDDRTENLGPEFIAPAGR